MESAGCGAVQQDWFLALGPGRIITLSSGRFAGIELRDGNTDEAQGRDMDSDALACEPLWFQRPIFE